jgi:[acyl-carrier-protein] S-malonyltransferase
MKKCAFIFPGQGSQHTGMGKDLYESTAIGKEYFDKANTVLGRSLSDICFEGTKEDLTLTSNAQPGIFIVSAIINDLLKEKNIIPSFVAGHSLGELTAYYASGALSFEAALSLIKTRGEAMAKACPSGTSGMAAVIGLSKQDIEACLFPYKKAPVVCANLNCPTQIVISGEKNALGEACSALKEKGGKVIPLPVSGAFHSPLMKSASTHLEAYMKDVMIASPKVPIILNRTGKEETQANALKENIHIQVISSVHWTDTILNLKDKVDSFIEVGPGKVLSGLVKKTDRTINCKSVSSYESLQSYLEEL